MTIFTNRRTKLLFGIVFFSLSLFILLSAGLLFLSADHAAGKIFLASCCVFAAVLIELYRYCHEQDRLIEKAGEQITGYISGNSNARIECDEEGELNKLFHKINTLAAILSAHAEKEAESKNFLKKTISDISHQLKTPLAALTVYNGIIQSEAENLPEIQKFTYLTEQELERMETLVQNLLKITKLDAGTIRFEKETENISEMMRDIKAHFLFRTQQEKKQIHLVGDDKASLLCDRDWFIQAIENIVKNALDHTGEGGQIQIEWKRLPTVVQLLIKDNGSGIHPEDMPHIFKRFYRSRFSKDTQGAGLGLPLSKAIIEAHRGSIEVDSTLNQGTAFVLNFLIPTKW